MAKQFTIRVKELTTEELHGLLRHMPKRTLTKLALHHSVPITDQGVALDLAQHKKCFTLLTFTIGFHL